MHNLGGLAGYPLKVNPHHKAGTTFKFQSCKDSAGISGPTHLSYCSDEHGTPPCYKAWSDSLRIIDPNSGTCLTSLLLADRGYFTEALYFKTCNNSGGYDIYEQLFTTQQISTYSGANFSGTVTDGSILFVPFGLESAPGVFYTDTDNMSILSPQYSFGVEYPPPDAITGYVVIDR